MIDFVPEAAGMTPREPLVDVVIPNYEGGAWLELCVKALEGFTKNPIRIIVVDGNSSSPEEKKILREIEERAPKPPVASYTVVHLAENRSFSNACNAGIRAGSAPLVVILNNDAIVQPGWDECFVQDLAEKKCGLTGARSNAASGLQSDTTGANDFVEPKFLVFVCVGMRREVWKEVGGLDEERFTGWSCEDLDFSWTVVKAGYRLKVSRAYVLHGLSRTLARTVGGFEQRRANDQKYQVKLAEKWGLDFVKKQTVVLPRIFVASFSAEEWTRVEYLKSLIGLRKSMNFDFSYLHTTRLPIHMARQAVCATVLANDFDYVMMIDDDAVFPPDTIARLMAHEKDVVTTLAYGRRPPYTTCVFASIPGDDKDGKASEMLGIEHTGLRKVDASGFHVSLIKVDVFRRLKAKGVDQWWGNFNKLGEDFFFSKVLKDNGIDLWCDTDFIPGHIGDSVVIDEQFKKAWLASTKQQLAPAVR